MAYSPVYSAPFVQYTPSTPNLSFAVPAGYTAVVRQISCVQDIGDWELGLVIQDSEAAPTLQVFGTTAIGAPASVQAEGRWVVPGGGIITVELTEIGSACFVYVGGYLLQNVLD